MKNEKGISLIETVIAIALLGIITVAFLGSMSTTSSARATSEERSSAKILAETIMENVKTENYTDTCLYNFDIPAEFPGYTATVNATSERNGSIQRIIITITHHNHAVLQLESYKTNR